jgi:tryptophanyl-tRNA synthetase
MTTPTKQNLFSGIQPTGVPTLGSYLGALKHWHALSRDYNCLFSVVDMHSITVRQDPAELRENSRNMLAWLVALGLDPEENILYFQSHVPAHGELAWILNCYAQMGELSRMTQFKEKSAKNEKNINVGLFAYPVLQAADILLYQTNLVPVGEDQKQHLELSRDICGRFNGIYGDIFAMPEPYIPPAGARIMGLQNPTNKMSKSEENANDIIFLSDAQDVIIKKFKRAVTDSDGEVRISPDKPGITNLLTIHACVTGCTPAESEKEFAGAGYGTLKMAVGQAVCDLLAPIQNEQKRLADDHAYIAQIAKSGAEKAAENAAPTLAQVKQAIGFPA